MPNSEIELNPVDFLTVGTVGPRGKRVFHLQAGGNGQIVTLTLEKDQARVLGMYISEMLDDLNQQRGDKISSDDVNMATMNMDLREPIEPLWRIGQMGLGYDETHDRILLVAQEQLVVEEGQDTEGLQSSTVRLSCTRVQMRALSKHTLEVVKQGRADPRSNGRILYYWT